LRTRIHRLLDGDQLDDPAGSRVRKFLTALILLNVLAVVLETVPWIFDAVPWLFQGLEVVSVGIFSIEFLLRLWIAPERPQFQSPGLGRARWLLTPAALIDLLAVLPSWLPWLGFDLRSVRLLRLVRILRVAKLGRYSVAVHTLQNVLRNKAADLLSLLFMLLVMLVVSSTVMYHFEHDAQPNSFSSIPATMWWGIVTLTTIGYGDMSPVTGAGRAFGGVVAILGIAMFALPAGLLGAAFVEELGRAREVLRGQHNRAQGGHGGTCPHCGKSTDAPN